MCVGYIDGTVRVVDLKSGQTLHTFDCHTQRVTSISTHQDNALILTGSTEGKAKILNASTGKVSELIVTFGNWISSFLRFAPMIFLIFVGYWNVE